ncbi:M56 family metallopeptidase [Flavobacteriaceae bacterium F89]|uniref:M56 family metallopeptidase n=1 Tax=Cerina litoralis TaxID=2874477 RepID=A0AAE3F069_9FLAO|nr:M56 family metallopeptidase [Cerina litoralis]MCG2462861.1 M56 family metallopeptidase [Cerina litoralis]
MIRYILECIAFQMLFLAIYDLFLKKETFFQWNRAYLLGTYFLSLALPWVKLEVLRSAVPQGFAIDPTFFVRLDEIILTPNNSHGYQWATVPWGYVVLYGGMFLSTVLLGYKLLQLYRLRKMGRTVRFTDFLQVIVPNSEVAFSFFRSIFLGEKVVEAEHEGIIHHELVHIKQRHSLDLLFFELMRIIGWFNPLVYIYQNRISELHEFIADAQVTKTHKKEQYQLLLSQVFQTQNISFINQFHQSSLIKKRIVMLTKEKSKQILKLKYLVLAPVVVAMLVYSSCQNEGKSQMENSVDTIIVGDIENMTPTEENEVYTSLKSHSESFGDWELKVADKNTTIRFTKSENGSYISGPDGVRVKAKMNIDSNDHGKDFNPLEDEASKAYKFPLAQGAVPFGQVEVPPVYPGCENATDQRACFNKMIIKHIMKNFDYPEEAQENGIQGRVAISFTIDQNGNITNIKKRGPDKLLEDEAVRLISKLPRMAPGKEKGKAVDVPFSIPITFKLQ